MAHVFDSGQALPQRRALREAIVGRLEPLRKASLPGVGSLYLEAVIELAAPFRAGDDELENHLKDAIQGRPLVATVALGERQFAPTGTDNREWRGDLRVQVMVVSTHARGLLARQAGDAVAAADTSKDPGLDTVLEHVFERLAGWDCGVAGVSELRPVSEDVAYMGADATAWELVLTAQVQTDTNPNRALTQVVVDVLATHSETEAGAPSALDALTTLEEP